MDAKWSPSGNQVDTDEVSSMELQNEVQEQELHFDNSHTSPTYPSGNSGSTPKGEPSSPSDRGGGSGLNPIKPDLHNNNTKDNDYHNNEESLSLVDGEKRGGQEPPVSPIPLVKASKTPLHGVR